MPTASKILNIGMPRTGTQSLTKALVHLGLRTVHYPRGLRSIVAYEAATEVRFSLKTLDCSFPESKYILTVRDPEVWLESCRRVRSQAKPSWNPFWFRDPSTWRHLYEERIREAEAVLGGTGRLLIYRLCEGAGWDPLCSFLGYNIPKTNYPRCDLCTCSPYTKPWRNLFWYCTGLCDQKGLFRQRCLPWFANIWNASQDPEK